MNYFYFYVVYEGYACFSFDRFHTSVYLLYVKDRRSTKALKSPSSTKNALVCYLCFCCFFSKPKKGILIK